MASNSNSDTKTVSDVFDEGLEIFNNLSKADEPTNSANVQSRIKQSISLLEESTRLVSLAGLFSSNESVDEVATSDIKFFLLPALLGTLTLKLCISNRIEVVNVAEVYFQDFLKRCKNYGIIDFEIPSIEPETTVANKSEVAPAQPLNLTRMVCNRNAKIQRFREQQELEKKLVDLKKGMENLNVDDDVKRSYYLTLIKSFASQAIDEIDCLRAEKPLIEYNMKITSGLEEKPKRGKQFSRKPLMPIIITKDEIQKKIYGAGYPSLPTMTVQEFYEKRVRDGDFPDPSASKPALQDLASEEAAKSASIDREIEEELKIENDDNEMLKQKRDFDDFKDTHRRGFGNRMNRS